VTAIKIAILIIEILGILGFSLLGVSAIVALLCFVCDVPFTFGKAAVIWLIWFAMNTARRKLNERNA
jgi:hypothetical protein